MKNVYTPSLAEFRELAAGSANLIPVYREFAADLETPVSVYIKLMGELGPSFLLESVEGGEQVGRYSFVGVNPRGLVQLNGRRVTITLDDDIDISRGDMICRVHNQPHVSQDVDAMIAWMSETSVLRPGAKYAVKHTTRWARTMIKDLQ